MTTVVGVRFKSAGKIYYFDPGNLPLKAHDHVIVETARGKEFGEVLQKPHDVDDESVVRPLKKVIRKANDKDLAKNEDNKLKEIKAYGICQEKIAARGLEMKLVDVEYTFDNSKIVFFFTADGRIDFRELVRDLAAVFRTRIELRQIGVRDEAKLLGGIGSCGRGLCCHTWLHDFNPVSIKMAKLQGMSLNPGKISGICGRLMCCLKYENDAYCALKEGLPKVGEHVQTPDGQAVVVDTNILREQVKVRQVLEPDKDTLPGEEKLSQDIDTYNKADLKLQHTEKKTTKKRQKKRGKHGASHESSAKQNSADSGAKAEKKADTEK